MTRRDRARRPRRPARLAKAVAALVEWERVARVASVSPAGVPHLTPVCHVLVDGRIYFGVGADSRKALNLAANPRLALTVDVYSDHWAALRGAMVQGTARLLGKGPEFRRVRAKLYAKYPQYPDAAALDESDSVIVEVTPTHVYSWGLK